jgi:hypothetical protein
METIWNKRVMDQISKIPAISKILRWDSILSKNEVALELYEAAEKLVNDPLRDIKVMCGEPRFMLVLESDRSPLAAIYSELKKGVDLTSENFIPPMFYDMLDQGHFLVYSEGIHPELNDIFMEDQKCFNNILNKHGIGHIWFGLFTRKEYLFVRNSKHLYQW